MKKRTLSNTKMGQRNTKIGIIIRITEIRHKNVKIGKRNERIVIRT